MFARTFLALGKQSNPDLQLAAALASLLLICTKLRSAQLQIDSLFAGIALARCSRRTRHTLSLLMLLNLLA